MDGRDCGKFQKGEENKQENDPDHVPVPTESQARLTFYSVPVSNVL